MTSNIDEKRTPESGERRKWRRKTSLSSSKIVHVTPSCRMDCVILNISEGGAKLRPADMGACPSRFALQLDGNRTRDCEVVWRKQDFLGVRFVSPWRGLNDLAEIVSRKNRT